VTSVNDFGAVRRDQSRQAGLGRHISEVPLSDEYVNSVGDVCKVGDYIMSKDRDRDQEVSSSAETVHGANGHRREREIALRGK